jgi:phage terminase large subunit
MDPMTAWASSARDPRLFVTNVLSVTPEPWQAEVLDAIGAGKARIAIRSGHGVGKTALLGWIVLWFALTRRDFKIPITANSQDQLRDVTWSELTLWARRLPEQLREQLEIGVERISLRADADNCFVVARTASKDRPEALQGFHARNLLFVLEEASGIDDVVFEVASGALSTPGAIIVMAGNPTRTSGYFYRAFHQNREHWTCFHVPCSASSRVAPEYAAQVAAEYGEHSNVYRVRVLGEFPHSEDNVVIPLALIEAAITRDIDPWSPRSMVWGVDVARYGDDRSALVKRRGHAIIEPAKIWRLSDTMQSAGVIAREYFDAADHDKPAAINVDVIGIGAGVLDRLRELGLPAYGVNVGETAEEPERFSRRRDELWWAARDWFNSHSIKISNDPPLIADLTAPTYKLLSNGKIQIESKDDIKKRGIASPDIADALCLTFAGGEHAHLIARQRDGWNRILARARSPTA